MRASVRSSIRLRISLIPVCLAVTLTACGGTGLTLQEYAGQAEILITQVRTRIATLDAEWVAGSPTPEGVRDYWEQRLAARDGFLAGLQALDPPDEAAELHENVVGLFTKLNATEAALAAHISSFDALNDHWQGWDSAEGRAARAADEELISICRIVQQDLDDTKAREVFTDMPWLPSDMKEIVEVVLGCPN